MPKARLGSSPIRRWNDDLAEPPDGLSPDGRPRRAAKAGHAGLEGGRRLPTRMAGLGPALDRHGVSVRGGRSSGPLPDAGPQGTKGRIGGRLGFVIGAGAPCVGPGEVARPIRGDRPKPLARKPKRPADETGVRGRNLTAFGGWRAGRRSPTAAAGRPRSGRGRGSTVPPLAGDGVAA